MTRVLSENEERRKHQETLQRMSLQDQRPHTQAPDPPGRVMADSDDEPDEDGDEEDKRSDPYEFLGLLQRGRTPLDDIRVTHRILGVIHHESKQNGKSETQKKHAEKRRYEIDWAVQKLLNTELKRAYDETGAIYQHEVDEWKKKSR
ncbi:hypothetical protein EJ02DRAFT_468119 [Clathrospora elynae]|uniref:J domain-containing protein n=1 Tax=Clathrospora elynae TaxID=706981 RepID=A0A6A5SI23_9PLEO|nr:hypothetical protein EJ02DRAFT_468119 [Clathrospora elynae]